MRHLAADVADNHHHCLGRHLGDLSHHSVILHAHLFADLERSRTESLESFLLSLLLAQLLLSLVVCTLRLSLLLSLPSCVDLLDLAFDVVVLVLLLLLLLGCKEGHKALKFLAGLLGGLLLSL